MIFKTHIKNVEQINDALSVYPFVYLHGDGNLYISEKNSLDHRDYTNPGAEAAKYRVKFSKGDTIPGTVEGLNKALMDARNNEVVEIVKPNFESKVTVIPSHKAVENKDAKLSLASEDSDEDKKAAALVDPAANVAGDKGIDKGAEDKVSDKGAVDKGSVDKVFGRAK